MVITSFKAQTTKIVCKNRKTPGKKAQKIQLKKLCIQLKFGGDFESIACYFNQSYLITESCYYGTETGIFACFNN